jgi:oligopeptide/dipeptide ABC transporter ATP-binding protein
VSSVPPIPPASAPKGPDLLLSVEDLGVSFATEQGEVRAVDGVSFQLRRGRVLALVGESGCGKTLTSLALLRLVQPPGRIVRGRITLFSRRAGTIDITRLREDEERLYAVRGGFVSMIFQEPMSALSPVHRVGDQIVEAIRLHQDVTKADARALAVALLRKVGVSAPDRRFRQYPHELSGGLRQRVVIALALGSNPELLIADEPTTALDVTTQAQILGVIQGLQHDLGCSVLLITHDFGVVAQMADDVAVMYLGRIVEQGSVRDLLQRPGHPYTQGLLRSLPGVNADGRLAAIPGAVPALTAIPAGCPFHPRCPHAQPGRCDAGGVPAPRPFGPGRVVACWRAEEIAAAGREVGVPSHPR